VRQFVTVPFKFYPSQLDSEPGSRGVQLETTGTGNSSYGKHIVTDLKFKVCWRKIPGPGIPGLTTRTVTQAPVSHRSPETVTHHFAWELNLGHGRELGPGGVTVQVRVTGTLWRSLRGPSAQPPRPPGPGPGPARSRCRRAARAGMPLTLGMASPAVTIMNGCQR
jgi:hypothetical protein